MACFVKWKRHAFTQACASLDQHASPGRRRGEEGFETEVCDLLGFIFQVDNPGCLWADVRTEPGLGDLLGSSGVGVEGSLQVTGQSLGGWKSMRRVYSDV